MSPKDNEELNQILDAITPRLYACFHSAMLEALRQHTSENAEVAGVDFVVDLKDFPKMKEADVTSIVEAPNGILSKPTQEEHLLLVGEFDADKWAGMFMRTNPHIDHDTMRAWFANAIMAGYGHKTKEHRGRLESMQNCLDIQGSQGNWDADPYMLGMFNGMEHMMAIMEGRDPQFRSLPPQEVQGEREVWAQAYAAAWGHGQVDLAADAAVKAFRERYK